MTECDKQTNTWETKNERAAYAVLKIKKEFSSCNSDHFFFLSKWSILWFGTMAFDSGNPACYTWLLQVMFGYSGLKKWYYGCNWNKISLKCSSSDTLCQNWI